MSEVKVLFGNPLQIINKVTFLEWINNLLGMYKISICFIIDIQLLDAAEFFPVMLIFPHI